MSKMELEGIKRGIFPMDKNEGIEACREYRARLHAQGYRTYLEYLWNGLFKVIVVEVR